MTHGISHAPCTVMTSRAPTATGVCPVCGDGDICVIRSTGLLRRHGFGPGRRECGGSYGPPVPSTSATSHHLSSRPIHRAEIPTSRPGPSQAGPRASTISVASNYAALQTPSYPATSIVMGGVVEPNVDGGVSHDQLPPSSFTPPHSSARILRWIPKGARASAATLLQSLLLNVVHDPSSGTNWSRLMGYAAACFGRPDRGGRSNNLTTAVLRAVGDYERNDSVLGGDNRQFTRGGRRGKAAKGDDKREAKIAFRACQKMCDGDVRRAVRILCSQDEFLPADQARLRQLQDLHPPTPPNRRPNPTVSRDATFRYSSIRFGCSDVIPEWHFRRSRWFTSTTPQGLTDVGG